MMAVQDGGPGGLTGWVLDVIDRLGEVGVAVLTFLETVFPPIPSEVILPLAGYLAYQGNLSLVGVLVASTVGAVIGALVLYWLGAALGEKRATRLLARLPLVDEEDVERANAWFRRHGAVAVFTGRLMPGVRSLVSLPAGTSRMPMGTFLLFTTLGTVLWNSLLVGGGYALGTQYQLVERYSGWLDVVAYVAIGTVLLLLVRRQVLKRRRQRTRSGA